MSVFFAWVPPKEEHVIQRFTPRMFIALFAVLAMLGAACSDSGDDAGSDGGDESTSEGGGESSGDGALSEFDLEGQSVTVGSKDFTEQLVLGEIYVQALEAAGADVTNQVNLGGTAVAREALLAGEIDLYPEYNGTGWTVHLGNEDPSFDSEELTTNVREADLEENSIRWVSQAPFNNTYGFAAGPDFVEENGELDLQGMADYIAEDPSATVCMESEFPSRPDGLVLFENETGFTIPQDQIVILDTGIIYNDTATGECTFGEIFTTDGRIPALELDVIDAEGVFILYNVSANLRDEVYGEHPDAYEEIFELIHEPLTKERMAELNSFVSVEGEEPADVARQYLEDEGLI